MLLQVLFLASSKRRGSVICPVSPSLPSKAILKEHADDCHHGQTSIGQLCIEPPGFDIGVFRCKKRRLPPKITRCITSTVPARRFAERHVCDYLDPTTNWHL